MFYVRRDGNFTHSLPEQRSRPSRLSYSSRPWGKKKRKVEEEKDFSRAGRPAVPYEWIYRACACCEVHAGVVYQQSVHHITSISSQSPNHEKDVPSRGCGVEKHPNSNEMGEETGETDGKTSRMPS